MDVAARSCYEQIKGITLYLLYLLYSASIGMKTVASNPSNKGIQERIKTNESNKFSNSGENEIEEGMASKDQESREIDTNSSSSKDKTKSGEYMLNRPPKKARRKGSVRQ